MGTGVIDLEVYQLVGISLTIASAWLGLYYMACKLNLVKGLMIYTHDTLQYRKIQIMCAKNF